VEKLRIAFLGSGSMGGAILSGLVEAGYPKELISATTRSEESALAWREQGISALSTESTPDANALIAGDADLIVLGVKPKQIVEVLGELAGEIGKNAVIISLAAGIELETMARVIENPNLIRTMPNTPALVRKAVTGIAPAASASQDAINATVTLFEAIGTAILVPEEKINALSAISGSGPAWIYYFIEQWEKIAIEQGFSEEDAKRLVRGTFDGSIDLLASSDEEPAQLRRNVTSPGGTTERIIATFDDADLKSLFAKGLAAAVARAQELAGK
jgi:pyrroline-5-carboxylate reductase